MHKILFIILICIGLHCKKTEETIDPTQPVLLWRNKLTDFYSTYKQLGNLNPIVYNNIIIYSSYKNNFNPNNSLIGNYSNATLTALNKNSGQKVWEWENKTTIDLNFEHNTSAYIYNNLLIAAISNQLNSNDFKFVAINLDNGKLVWEKLFVNKGFFINIPISGGLQGYKNKMYYQTRNNDGTDISYYEFDINTQQETEIIHYYGALIYSPYFKIYQSTIDKKFYLAANTYQYTDQR
ncbi:MAG: hypothetical protein ORN58_06745, partial [Sediminibacterium sp.]|nr:hypothetical protein [Sediminibacterium sp.]